MAVYNEEERILDTVKSVYEWIDEAVIVDGTSSDNTVAVLKKFDTDKKIKILIEDNPANFIVNKQKALDACSGDWILELDADEIVTADLKAEIQNILKDPGEKVAFWMPRLNHFLGSPLTKGGQYPDYTLRLYKRGHARFPVVSVHDQVEIDGEKTTKANVIVNEKIGQLTNPLLHYPYKDLVSFFRKWAQYASFDGDDLYKKGVRPSFKNAVIYLKLKPIHWFLLTYFRHRGYVDGFAGFMFSLLSGLRFWVMYMQIVSRAKH